MKRTALIAGLALPLFGCVETQEDTHKVVAVLPLSGDFKALGENHKQGLQMAIDSLQRVGLADVLGKPVSVLLVDSGQKETIVENTAKAIEEAKSVAGQDFLGVISSTEGAYVASLPLAIEEQVPHFEIAWGGDEAEFIHDHETDHPVDEDDIAYAFNARGLCNDEALMTAQFIKEKWGVPAGQPKKKLLMFRRTHTHDKMHTQVIFDELARIGDPVELIRSTDQDAANGNEEGAFILSESTSWQDELQGLINTHQPDVIFFHLTGDVPNQQALLDLSKVNGTGYEGQIVTCGMARKTSMLDPALFPPISYLAGRFYWMMRAPVASTDLQAFKADYEELWGVDPHTYAPGAFDAGVMLLLGSASAKINGTDVRLAIEGVSTPDGERVSYTSLGKAIDIVGKGGDVDYEGPSGTLDMEYGTHIIPSDYYVEAVAPADNGMYQYVELDSPARQTLRNGEVILPK